MKKTRLLTSFIALSLVFSLEACSTEEANDFSSDDDTVIDDSGSEHNTESGNTDVSSGSENTDSTSEDDGTVKDATNPAELISNIHKTSNYTITIEYTQYLSDPITYYDYYYGNYNLSALEKTYQVYSSYLVEFFFTDEAFLIEEYMYYEYNGDYEYWLVYSELFVEGDYYGAVVFDDFVLTADGWSCVGTYYNSWKDYYYNTTLFMEGESGYFSAESFTYYGEGTYGIYPCTGWSLTSNEGAKLFLLLGTDAIFSNPSSATISKYYGLTYFFEQFQEMLIYYGYYGFTYFQAPTEWTDYVYLCETDFFANVYNVGLTNLDNVIYEAYMTASS